MAGVFFVLDQIKKQLNDGIAVRKATADSCGPDIEKALKLIIGTYSAGGKLLICGNGGSAADSQHFAAELVGRFMKERKPLSAISLTTDTSILTAVSNDYSFESVFRRQVEAHGSKGDALFAISTSGNSKNILSAMEAARKKGLKVIALSGRTGGKMKALADVCICVPANTPDRIQEVHIAVIHILCDLLEKELF